MNEAFRQGMAAVPHLAATGITFESVDDGRAVMSLAYREDLVGFADSGVLAGGIIYTLMDTVSGAAVFAALKTYRPIATLDLRIDYLRPATPHQTVYGRAEVIKLTHHIAFVRGTADHGDPQDPIAHVTGTFALKGGAPTPPPGPQGPGGQGTEPAHG
ncbi:uncharacterized protein (TIGR00369 family) [Rhodothalassium salexigens DSM 2132]|uniref:Uncharacterized protein (TIGR00369 family) n=1 Tax=Rhodothalassium salexigens DSM 2132 TaxID=1188247 RepID=A0A4R2PGD8_RHOSA|nr:PaaI family thioesterase [Rhodothalassium salexigens]MBB4211656.1 uncharacterized protein (TIGR00369 family) [Rhodothalassium salexigens DSM 2132]MBK1640038.1 hypothetical protein [Rhodothalassium salexigens DSM 2132]TCP34412.1 uncharacterized protein (TIGR00369 family) [Rhodothalassium salexigens DSM 2132]